MPRGVFRFASRILFRYKAASSWNWMTMPMSARLFAPFALAVLLGGCQTIGSVMPWNGSSSNIEANVKAKEANDPATTPVETLYNNGVDALNGKRYSAAVKEFDNVEQYYPYSSWSTNAQLMHGYAEYLQNHYTDAIPVLDRFIQLHPTNRDIAYAYYLRALCYYEQIADISRDQHATDQAMTALQEVANRFPDSAYAQDAQLKIDLCRDHLAGKEMEIGRYYERQHLYTAAINRFQRVVDDYQTTNHVPEALHRLTEIYLMLGLTDQAKVTAAVLGHNYPGNRWYADTYNQLLADNQIPNAKGQLPQPKPGFFARNIGAIF
jgi:outer membrane protein assembly factor BamD